MPQFLIASHFTLNMEAAWFSEMLESYHITTLHQSPEELSLNLHRHAILKSHIIAVPLRHMWGVEMNLDTFITSASNGGE
jgi:hypothetical protein